MTELRRKSQDQIRFLLEQELKKRCEKNPRYSMRSFAKALGTSHSFLSMFFSKKRALSEKMTEKALEMIDISPEQKKSIAKFSEKKWKTQAEEKLSLDRFSVVSDWFYYAILNLFRLKDVDVTPKSIFKIVGISETEAKLALDRLERIDLIDKTTDGKWQRTAEALRVDNEYSTQAARKFHRQLLKKAESALEDEPFERRAFESITTAISSKNVEYARQRIGDFLNELSDELEEMGEPTDVYNINIQLHPLTKQRKSND